MLITSIERKMESKNYYLATILMINNSGKNQWMIKPVGEGLMTLKSQSTSLEILINTKWKIFTLQREKHGRHLMNQWPKTTLSGMGQIDGYHVLLDTWHWGPNSISMVFLPKMGNLRQTLIKRHSAK